MPAPTTMPELSPAGERIYARLAPFQVDEVERGYPVAHLALLLGALVDDIAGLTAPVSLDGVEITPAIERALTLGGANAPQDSLPGPVALAIPALAPAWALPWLAYRAGVDINPEWTEAQIREAVAELPASKAGTPGAVIAAARLSLTDARLARLIERDGSPFVTTVVVWEAATPDPDRVARDVLRQLPFELLLNLDIRPGWTWAEMLDHFGGSPTWAEVVDAAETDTWTEVAHHLPDA